MITINEIIPWVQAIHSAEDTYPSTTSLTTRSKQDIFRIIPIKNTLEYQ